MGAAPAQRACARAQGGAEKSRHKWAWEY
jgi:hypothetical protein